MCNNESVCEDQERLINIIFVLEEASIRSSVLRNLLLKILYIVKSGQFVNNNHIFVEDSVI